MEKIIIILIWILVYGLTGVDMYHLFIEYWSTTESVIFVLVFIFIIVVELLVFYSKKLTFVISLKKRRYLQLGIHILLIGHTLVLKLIHQNSTPTIVFTIIISMVYFFFLHPWSQKIIDKK